MDVAIELHDSTVVAFERAGDALTGKKGQSLELYGEIAFTDNGRPPERHGIAYSAIRENKGRCGQCHLGLKRPVRRLPVGH